MPGKVCAGHTKQGPFKNHCSLVYIDTQHSIVFLYALVTQVENVL